MLICYFLCPGFSCAAFAGRCRSLGRVFSTSRDEVSQETGDASSLAGLPDRPQHRRGAWMGTHPDDTWCKKIEGDNGPVYVNWLEDPRFLPAVVPCARIMRYSYNRYFYGPMDHGMSRNRPNGRTSWEGKRI
jgi:hypothetical protein